MRLFIKARTASSRVWIVFLLSIEVLLFWWLPLPHAKAFKTVYYTWHAMVHFEWNPKNFCLLVYCVAWLIHVWNRSFQQQYRCLWIQWPRQQTHCVKSIYNNCNITYVPTDNVNSEHINFTVQRTKPEHTPSVFIHCHLIFINKQTIFYLWTNFVYFKKVRT